MYFKALLYPSYIIFIKSNIISFVLKSHTKSIEIKNLWLTRALSITFLSMGQGNFVARRENKSNVLKNRMLFLNLKIVNANKKYKNISKIFLLVKIDNSELLETLNKITSTPWSINLTQTGTKLKQTTNTHARKENYISQFLIQLLIRLVLMICHLIESKKSIQVLLNGKMK